jgi:anti-anti-sigma factor
MDWQTSTTGTALVGRQQGRVDERNWQAFSDHLVAAIETAKTGGQRFVVDLSGIDYMSSRGLRALSTALASAKTAGVDMSLAAPGEAMRQILSISRYDKLFAVHASVADAGV